MGDTSISWTDKTWNPGQGCSRVSEGCRNCYAERLAARFAENGWSKGLINLKTGKWNGVVRLAPHKLAEPLSWRKPCRVFVNSMTDLFHDGYTNEEIAAVFGVMAAAPQHTFQILTKRARRMREWFEWVESSPEIGAKNHFCVTALAVCRDSAIDALGQRTRAYEQVVTGAAWPLSNVWLGVSVENQDAADKRIPELLRTPAAIRFLSCEPLLGRVNLRGVSGLPTDDEDVRLDALDGTWRTSPRDEDEQPIGGKLDWVIAGCESGPGMRRCEVEWLRSIRDQCAASGVAFFLKQAVEMMTTRAVYPGTGADRVTTIHVGQGQGSKLKGARVIELPYLDGVQHAAFPEVR